MTNLTLETPAAPAAPARAAGWRRLAPLLRPVRWPLVGAVLLLLAVNLAYLLMPAVLGGLIDRFQGTPERSRIAQQVLTLVLLFAVQALASYGQQYLTSQAAERTIFELRLRLYQHIQHLPLQHFVRSRVSELASHLTSDIDVLRAVIASDTLDLLRHAVFVLGALGLMVWMNWRLTLLALLSVLGMSLITQIAMRRLHDASSAAQDALAQANGQLEESLLNIGIVRVFGREPFEQQRLRGAFERVRRVNLRRERLELLLLPLSNIVAFGALALVLWFGLAQVLDGQSSPGDLVAYLSYAAMLAASLAQLSQGLGRVSVGLGALDHVYALLDLPAEAAQPDGVAESGPLAGRIELIDVSASYPGQHQPALQHCSLRIEPGEVVALVGPSGAGKTSLVQLVLGLYRAQSGQILIDGRPIEQLDPRRLREQIGAVLQDTHLFSGSVAENIRYGRLEASDAEVEAAARQAQAHEFIRALPQGYQSDVGQRGAALSAGQRQRICIARMLVRRPRILILDEATSALDSANERLIQTAIDAGAAGRTVLVIAHRLATVRRADRIVVLDQGRIVETGSHDELIARGGLYARLYQQQHSQEHADARLATADTRG